MTKFCENLIEQEENEKKSNRSFYLFVIILLFIVIFINIFRFEYFMVVTVSGYSMLDTVDNGDVLVCTKVGEIERGDIIVFQADPNGNYKQTNYIKRVIGLPGDTVYISNGIVYVDYGTTGNFVQIDESYLTTTKIGSANLAETRVADNCLFVLGDNRRNSVDSRTKGYFSKDGLVDISNVLGIVTKWSIKYKDEPISKLFKYL